MPRSNNPELRSTLMGGRANRPDFSVKAASRVKSSRGFGDHFESLLADTADWFELCESTGRVISRSIVAAPGLCARLRLGHSDRSIASRSEG